MKISSRFEVTTLNECMAGDLIRDVQFPSEAGLAFVADALGQEPTTRLIVGLGDAVEAQKVDADDEIAVIRYLDPPVFVIDHVHGVRRKMEENQSIRGAVVCDKDGAFLNVPIRVSGPQRLVQINLETGRFRQARSSGFGGVFLSWSLFLPSVPDVAMKPVELFKFTAQG